MSNADIIAEQIKAIRKEIESLQGKLDLRRDTQYLIHIWQSGTVEGADRSMADVFRLLELGLLHMRNDGYDLTPLGITQIKDWEMRFGERV